jgi:CDP-glucose 4,6-dehydratase
MKTFWRGRKVFVTGHTGFKGSWLCLWLQSLGAEVTGYALTPPTNPSLFETARVAEGMTSIIGDVRDGEALAQAMVQAQPEIVIHMAAQALVRRSYVEPVESYAVNVMGTVNLFEAVRRTPTVKAVVNVTSDKCYENRERQQGYREDEPLGGFDPYSSSKGCAELVTAAYRNSYFSPEKNAASRFVAVASARAGNVIGGGDWAEDRLIPDFLRAMDEGRPVVIRSPHAVRPWQHVLEPLGGYLLLARKLLEQGQPFAEAWNFGPDDDDARPVQWIVEQLTERCGEGASWQLDSQVQPHEAQFLRLDCSKARERLNWQPRWNLSVALDAIVDWHQARRAGQDMRVVTLDQIHEFIQ